MYFCSVRGCSGSGAWLREPFRAVWADWNRAESGLPSCSLVSRPSLERARHRLHVAIKFSLGRVSVILVYRGLIAIRGSWIFAEWIFGWGVYSHASLFKSTHPYATLTVDAITVAFWVVMLVGMWFFQRWARLIFVVL